MSEHYPQQQVYLLRLWPVEINGRRVWRASLQSIPAGERHGFANLEKLCEYLHLQTDSGDDAAGQPAAEEAPS